MIDLGELKYGLGGLGAMIAFCFLGALPLISRVMARQQEKEASLLERSAIAIAVSVVYLALLGFLLALLPLPVRRAVAWVGLLVPVLAGLAMLGRGGIRVFFPRGDTQDVLFHAAALVLAVFAIALSSGRYPLPAKLPDGAYVNKESVQPVQIQYLTGDLPADNVVPYVAQEYLARDISFERNSPILPGQHVTNRPILVSLVGLPIRVALAAVTPLHDLPRYEYVGIQWPDFRVLARDVKPFSIFLGVGIFLNACLLLGVGLILTRMVKPNARQSLLFSLLFITSPYFLFQTIFTWPKALAGFFVLLAVVIQLSYCKSLLAGVLLGLAYWSHPYAIGYVVVGGLGLLLCSRGLGEKLKQSAAFGIGFAVCVAPWFIWAKLVIGIDSDLVEQNFSSNGMSTYQFLLARVVNVVHTVVPEHLLAYGAPYNTIFAASQLNLAGAMGVLLLLIGLLNAYRFGGSSGALYAQPGTAGTLDIKVVVAYLGAASLLLSLVFSNHAVPLLHGWQPFAAVLLGLVAVLAVRSGKIVERVAWAQVVMNIATLAAYVTMKGGRLATVLK
ncbi:Glycosyltransferase RgtA/B/C/D-like domain-containing protein [Cupriavidus oxalaticus]|uniref:hypothetical protein n=1 Tax=Cupriavidus oxalaticus TaxID=96344 RepID=UPI003F732F27